jgi:acetate CoA/acetoacetate CoA-transferase alpha subunit
LQLLTLKVYCVKVLTIDFTRVTEVMKLSLHPKFITPDEAAELIPDGSSVMFGGFIGCGGATQVIDAICRRGTQKLHGIFDDASLMNGPDGSEYYNWAKLIHSGQIVSYVGSHLGTNPDATARWAAGELEATLVPQGSFAEMIRAGGFGLGGVVTPTGVGTLVEESPLTDRKITIDGRDYLVMKPLKADFAVIRGFKVDKCGNIWYKGSARNFAPLMATAAETVIVEAENIVEVGEIEPENVHTPGFLVDYIVEVQR